MKKLSAFILVGLWVSSVSAQLANSPWPMFGHDARHTGQSLSTGPEVPELKWSYDTDCAVIFGSVIGSDSTIYVGNWDYNDPGKVYAVNPDGTVKWSYNLGGGVRGIPALDSNTVYVASQDGNLHAIEDSIGKVKWSYFIGESFASPTIGPDGTVYIVSNERKIYAINSNGTLKWSLVIGAFNESLWSSPAIFGASIYVGSSDKKLHAIDTSGTEKWTFLTGSQIHSSPAVSSDGNRIYFGSIDGCFYVLDSCGAEISHYQTRYAIVAPPVLSDSIVCIRSRDDTLYAFNPDGKLLWRYQIGLGPTELAMDAKGIVYASSNHKLCAINPNGVLKWTCAVAEGQNFFSPSIGPDGRIYLGTSNGKLCCVGEKDSVSVEETDLPRRFALSQNVSNPFSHQTAISYQLSARTKISLEIYSLTGQLIRTLVNGERKAGRHSVIWDGKDKEGNKVANGIYFYRLKGGGIEINKKMVFIK